MIAIAAILFLIAVAGAFYFLRFYGKTFKKMYLAAGIMLGAFSLASLVYIAAALLLVMAVD